MALYYGSLTLVHVCTMVHLVHSNGFPMCIMVHLGSLCVQYGSQGSLILIPCVYCGSSGSLTMVLSVYSGSITLVSWASIVVHWFTHLGSRSEGV